MASEHADPFRRAVGAPPDTAAPYVRPLEADEARPIGMDQRLVQAAARLFEDARVTLPQDPGRPALRPEQTRVFDDFATYLTDLATRPPSEQAPPFARIIQPPRTGKTVVAGHIIDRTGLQATFIVPTRTLLEQTVRELGRQLPGVAIGSYYGEAKRVVEHGVNVVTYAMLQKAAKDGLPSPLARSALVLVDEAHHAMTPARMTLLRQAFDPLAVRLALTATPDFDEERTLCRHFPDLIHEITLEEALELELLAPLRVWVAEVDADASRVRFLANDYDLETLGRLMSSAPFFRAVELFRYDADHAERACLIACASRQQAHDLHQYLCQHRPAGRPASSLILGDTPPEQRRSRLARFERGELDTLIQVGVLVEGWNSPRCKLLLDLAPSASRVRATQKYFRVMTRHGVAEARIFVLLPKNLPRLPVLPMELFGRSLDEYECGQRIGREDAAGRGSAAIERLERTPVEGVTLRKRILLSARLEKPALDPTRPEELRAVLASCADFDPARPCHVQRFRGLIFRHRLFFGRGEFLLRWLGVRATRDAYHAFLGRLYPEVIADRMLAEDPVSYADVWCAADREHFERALLNPRVSPGWRPEEPYCSTWRALTGAAQEVSASPQDLLLARAETDAICQLVGKLVGKLTARTRRLVSDYFGLSGQPPCTLEQLGAREDVTGERIRTLIGHGLQQLRRQVLRLEYQEVFGHSTRPELLERAQRDAIARRDALPVVGAGSTGDAAPFIDVDGFYRPTAWDHPTVRRVIRRVRKIAFVRMVKNGALHVDFGALETPCGRAVADVGAEVIEAASFYSGRLPRARICGACVANRRHEVAQEMAILESQLSPPTRPQL